jgi:hypothetical protein
MHFYPGGAQASFNAMTLASRRQPRNSTDRAEAKAIFDDWRQRYPQWIVHEAHWGRR